MAQQPLPIEAPTLPRDYRELYAAVGYQAGEPEAARLVASYRFTDGGGGRRAPHASQFEGTDLRAQRATSHDVSMPLT